MEGTPKFIKSFSKDYDQPGRNALAKEIRELRAHNFDYAADNSFLADINHVDSIESDEVNEDVKVLGQIKTWLLQANQYLPAHIQSVLSRFGVNPVSITESLSGAEVVENIPTNVESSYWRKVAQQSIQNFYDKQIEKWKNASYESAEIEEYFESSFLSSLSLEDYTLLLSRFPSQMATHVTRQGVRDHTGAVFHFSGVGEYWDGFRQIMESGELKNFMSLCVTEDAKKEGIAKLLKFDELTKDEALARLEDMCDVTKQRYDGGFSDRDSVHFAAEEVADAHYGAERGNEIFLAYPSLYVASQCYFNGQLSEAKGGGYNNQMVFPKEDRGVPVNAGITFIPKNARVDAVTGSRYELDQEMRPSQNELLINQIQDLINRKDFKDFASNYADVLGNNLPNSPVWISAHTQANQELQNTFGINDVDLLGVVTDYNFLFHAKSESSADTDFIGRCLQRKGLYYKPSVNTVASEVFWTNYFTQNSDKQPNKVVFYEGTDPTQALHDWRNGKGLTKRDAREDLGFSKNQLDLTTENQRTENITRFKSLAESIINDHYS